MKNRTKNSKKKLLKKIKQKKNWHSNIAKEVYIFINFVCHLTSSSSKSGVLDSESGERIIF